MIAILEEQVFGLEIGKKTDQLSLFNLPEVLEQPLSFDRHPTVEIDGAGHAVQTVVQDWLVRSLLTDDEEVTAVAIAQGWRTVISIAVEPLPSKDFAPDRGPQTSLPTPIASIPQGE